MVGQATGIELLVLAIGADQQGDEQADAATVHVFEVSEVEDDRAGLVAASLVISVGQRLVGRYRAGVRDGVWRQLRADGKKVSEGGFVDDLRQGAWTLYLDDGSRAQGEYLDDQRQGRWVVYGKNGNRRAEGPVVDGVRQGVWSEYDARGRLLAKGPYINDRRHGEWTLYSAAGKRQGQVRYRDGQRHDAGIPELETSLR